MSTFHLVALPHTQVTADFNHCAYTSKARKWASMMVRRGHKVYLYASEDFDGDPGVEVVTCITKNQQQEILGDEGWFQRGEVYGVSWDAAHPLWRAFNEKVAYEISERIQERDFICLTTGIPHLSLIRFFPGHQVIEYGIGYEGVVAEHRVYESYAWMHAVEGARQGAQNANGRFYDAVIPNYFEVDDFPYSAEQDDYCLFMSRMTERKGYEIAIEATRRMGTKLIVAGVGGDRPEADHVEYVGYADTRVRGVLMARAQAVFMPTLYLEPFGGVAVESMLCGTPVISTDWGAFPELIEHGKDGYRCRSIAQFTSAIGDVKSLNRQQIRRRARARFSTEVIAERYESYFDHLSTLWAGGFYS
jgi:glycosyltransferase involved in cell wall biosynthesis